jgi:hypothetical protein
MDVCGYAEELISRVIDTGFGEAKIPQYAGQCTILHEQRVRSRLTISRVKKYLRAMNVELLWRFWIDVTVCSGYGHRSNANLSLGD